MKRITKLIFFGIFLIFLYIFVNNFIYGSGKLKIITQFINQENKELIKKIFFPYKTIDKQREQIEILNNYSNKQNKKIEKQRRFLLDKEMQFDILKKYYPTVEDELSFKQSGKNIKFHRYESFELSNNITLRKFYFLNGFLKGVRAISFPGSGYIDFHKDNLFVLSTKGILGYSKSIDENMLFEQIPNNLNDYFSLSQFKKNSQTYFQLSFRDLTIHNNTIYISFNEEIENNCWNTSVLVSEVNYKKLNFKKLFSSNKCVHTIDNIDKEFTGSQGGGRIVVLDDNHILLSVGEYRSRFLAQETDSINGKILKININDLSYNIVSMGHRNPQGLYFDNQNKFILETEHGPKGGDEINIIHLSELKNKSIPNYGWPVASYGVHYKGENHIFPSGQTIVQKYPLYKSHSDHGFIEPLKQFTPSIGISEIIKVDDNSYVVSSLKDKTLYFFELNDAKEIKNITPIEIGERIRDLKIKDKKLFMFLENTASIAYINLN